MICKQCQKEFNPPTPQSKYCCDECRYQSNLALWRDRFHNKKKRAKIKGLNDLEKNLKQQGDFYDEYRKWKIAKAMEKVDPIILEVSHDK